ncbi:hypothetical protein [Streptomyces sp. NBC_01320]|uniref:hypothetical protein n=1 Tax=Streptomyces sp. NBC_01320 TaxID=2903824 RepID=UPI003FA360DE
MTQFKRCKAGLAGAAVATPDLHVLNGTGRPVHTGDVIGTEAARAANRELARALNQRA